MRRWWVSVCLAVFLGGQVKPAPIFSSAIDTAVAKAIADHKLPGVVIVVGHGDAILLRKAYGNRAVAPAPEPMTIDTIFDLASLTKVVATTPAIMQMVEQGKIRLTDPVATFIPEFARYGKDRITVRDLLMHMSGLRPDLDLGDAWTGHDAAIARAIEEVPAAPPGRRFVYSDINYLLLGEIVARVSGAPLERYASEHIFAPLGMRETTFNPTAALVPRIAPTQQCTPADAPCDGPGGFRRRRAPESSATPPCLAANPRPSMGRLALAIAKRHP
jgi:CubicO group peptidase (beta-lactamase class C family)